MIVKIPEHNKVYTLKNELCNIDLCSGYQTWQSDFFEIQTILKKLSHPFSILYKKDDYVVTDIPAGINLKISYMNFKNPIVKFCIMEVYNKGTGWKNLHFSISIKDLNTMNMELEEYVP